MKNFISLGSMGQKRETRPSTVKLFETVSRMLVPEYILEHFDINEAKEYPSCWVIDLREKEGLIPSELKTAMLFCSMDIAIR